MSISYAVHRHLHSFPTRRSSDLWLPEGEWIEWSTGKHFKGPLEVSRKFSIREIPVYVRSGAILPMAPEMRYTNEKPVDPLTLTVFPLRSEEHTSELQSHVNLVCRPPTSTLFPYTTLFRSVAARRRVDRMEYRQAFQGTVGG